MPVVYEAFPDAEALVSTIVRDGTGARVYSSIPKSPTYPLITVKRIGGIPSERHHLDCARMQIDVWGGAKGDAPGGPTKSDIRDLAITARIAVFGAEGQTLTAPMDAFISGVEDSFGLSWQPDPPTGRDRYIFGLEVYFH